MDKLSLSEKINILRTRKGFTKKQLSDITGIHWATISKYEHNHMQPSIEALSKLAQALETSTDYLIFNNFEEKITTSIKTKQWLELAEKVDQLETSDKKYIFDTVQGYLNRAKLA